LNFEEQILEAAKSIAAATSALVKAASAAQRELVAQGKVRHFEHFERNCSPKRTVNCFFFAEPVACIYSPDRWV